MSETCNTATIWPPADRLYAYVTESNLVDYGKLAQQEKEWLKPVIDAIKATDPRNMDSATRHAFLINAYNLWTLHWVIRERERSRWQGALSTFSKARFFYWHNVYTGAGRRNLFNLENKVIQSRDEKAIPCRSCDTSLFYCSSLFPCFGFLLL